MTTEQLTIAQVLLRQFDPQRALHQCGTAGVLLLHSLRPTQQFGRRSPPVESTALSCHASERIGVLHQMSCLDARPRVKAVDDAICVIATGEGWFHKRMYQQDAAHAEMIVAVALLA